MKEIRQVIKSNGIKISGSICHPDEISGHHPFLLILHGIPSPEGRKLSVQEKGYLEICKQFCDGGFITTIFNLQGCKGSEGQYSPLNWVGNVKSILDYVLSSESNIDQDNVGI
ncbi:MAG: alpha/beta hydrolase family protein, partial [Candidatus Helarchaeales archaeon]